MGIKKITIRGARQHNLKNISLEIPRNTLTVITGLSGSGKSSLAFDTLYAEGQRRYVESLSTYARQFLDQMERPDVDSVEGLSPSIAIEQKTTTRSPRSTVGTITEIYDYLRVIYSSIGTPHCPNCGKPITRQSTEQIVQVGAGAEAGRTHHDSCSRGARAKGRIQKRSRKIPKEGYLRARIDGDLVNLDDPPKLDRRKNHTIEIVIDRLLLKEGIAQRLEQSIETALKLTARPRHRLDRRRTPNRFIPKNWPAPIAGFPFRSSSRVRSVSIRRTAPARNATGSDRNTPLIPRK